MTRNPASHLSALALCVGLGLAVSPAQAQSYSGRRLVAANCGGNENSENLPSFPCGVDSRQTSCVSQTGCITFGSGPGAEKSAMWERSAGPGQVGGATQGTVSLLGHPCGAAGNASSQLDVRVVADDLLFYVRADPSQSGSAQAGMNLEFRGRLSIVRGPGCATGFVEATVVGGATSNGGLTPFRHLTRISQFGLPSEGPLASYPNDDTPFIFTFPAEDRPFNVPHRVALELRLAAHSVVCGSGEIAVFSDARATVSLPASGPVFDLPEGVTCSSVQLGIVDNRWMGPGCCLEPCCPADFNNSGGLTVQDIFDFLAAYFASDPAADFNGEIGLTVQDIFDFLEGYFTGCPL